MKLELFPPDIIEEYGLRDKVDTDGNVFCEVQCGMYGLPQAGIIAQDLLTKQLQKAGYCQRKSPQAIGNTTGAPSVSTSLLMTLE